MNAVGLRRLHLRRWLSAFCLVALLLSAWAIHQDNLFFGEVVRQLDREGYSDEEYVLVILDYVAHLEVYSVASGQFPPNPGPNAALYSAIPINVIPPQVVLQERLAYRGLCGALSRALAALLNAAGFPARTVGVYDADYRGVHTVVEVDLGDGWVPLDTTDGVYFMAADGYLMTTAEIAAADEAFFAETVARFRDEPPAYNYDHVQGFTPFYIAFTAGRILGFWGWEDSAQVYEDLAARFGQAFIAADLGTPLFFDQPKLLLLYVPAAFLLILLPWEGWAWRRTRRRIHGAPHSEPQTAALAES